MTEEPKTCVFCRSPGKMTGEHVFGDWISRIGLPAEPVQHAVGRLNRSLRGIGVSRPFTRVVRDVCASCNNGWMAKLEDAASRVLRPMILGTPANLSERDAATVAAWIHKTALVNMLMTDDAEQARGDLLLGQELRHLYAIKEHQHPPSQTQFWSGRYTGEARVASAWVTPMVAFVEGLGVPAVPQAYAMTLVIGRLLLQGLRFTLPLLEFEVQNTLGLAPMWPTQGVVPWAQGEDVGDEQLLKVGKGLNLRPRDRRFVLTPWKPAVDLEDSVAEGESVRLPTPCGVHFVLYPGHLVAEASRRVFYAFMTACECPKVYLVVTELDGAHFKSDAADDAGIAALVRSYARMAGEEVILSTSHGEFACKRVAT